MPTSTIKTGGRPKRQVDLFGLVRIVEDIISGYDGVHVVTIEHVSASPQMGVSSAFNFGGAAMAVEACFAFHSMVDETIVRIEKVNPAVWKREMKLIGQTKDASRHKASRLWPRDAGQFKLAKDDGRAEAALIAEHGRRITIERERRR